MVFPRPGRVPSLALWARRLLAGALGASVAAAVAAPLLRATGLDFDGLCGFWLFVGATQLERRWWPRRNSRLTWRQRVAGRHAVEPGLVARRSLAGWVSLTATVVWVGAGTLALISVVPPGPEWGRVARVLLILGLGAGLGLATYQEVRYTGRLAITASGIRYGRRWYAWDVVDRAAVRRRDGRTVGVRLRLLVRQPLEPDPVVGGRDTAVPDERLVAAIEEYRPRPHLLAAGPVTAPEPARTADGG